MTAKCLAIVWAPNLVPPPPPNPPAPPTSTDDATSSSTTTTNEAAQARLATLKRTEAALEFTRKVLLARLYTLGYVTARDTTASPPGGGGTRGAVLDLGQGQGRRPGGAGGGDGEEEEGEEDDAGLHGVFASPIALSKETLEALASAGSGSVGAGVPMRIPSSGALGPPG